MVKKILFIVLAMMMVRQVYAQQVKNDEKIVRRVANYIIANTEYGFVDTQTGKVYPSADDLPENAPARLVSLYTHWEYWDGVLNLGMIELGNTLNDSKYTSYVSDKFQFIYKNLDHFRKPFEAGDHQVPFNQFYQFHALDNCGAMDASLIEVYNQDKRPEYRKTINRAARYISSGQFRLKNGTLVRDYPYKMSLWADDLYMSVPFLARMGKLTGDKKYFDDAAHQVIEFHHYLFDPREQIYFHGWFSDENADGVAHWGRANGWIMMAQVELLKYLPKDDPHRDTLLSILRQQVRGIARYQDKSGLWHQLLDKRDSYKETSCTAMFVYGIAKAVNEGWIDERYFPVAWQGWQGLKSEVTDDGQVKDVCVGTGIGNDLNFYYTRPKRLNDPHVLGAFLMAGSEIIKHEQK